MKTHEALLSDLNFWREGKAQAAKIAALEQAAEEAKNEAESAVYVWNIVKPLLKDLAQHELEEYVVLPSALTPGDRKHNVGFTIGFEIPGFAPFWADVRRNRNTDTWALSSYRVEGYYIGGDSYDEEYSVCKRKDDWYDFWSALDAAQRNAEQRMNLEQEAAKKNAAAQEKAAQSLQQRELVRAQREELVAILYRHPFLVGIVNGLIALAEGDA